MTGYRVVQWATGNIGTRSLRAVIEHPTLTLAGLYVHGVRHYACWLGVWTAADPAGRLDGARPRVPRPPGARRPHRQRDAARTPRGRHTGLISPSLASSAFGLLAPFGRT